jgi:hypothetical protein
MHRYFFEFSLGERRVRDGEGEAFVTRVAALKYGRLLAGEMAKRNVADLKDACVVVLDERGDELGRIFLLDVVQAGALGNGSRHVLH